MIMYNERSYRFTLWILNRGVGAPVKGLVPPLETFPTSRPPRLCQLDAPPGFLLTLSLSSFYPFHTLFDEKQISHSSCVMTFLFLVLLLLPVIIVTQQSTHHTLFEIRVKCEMSYIRTRKEWLSNQPRLGYH